MDAAAKLGGEAADFNDADALTIFFAEEGSGAEIVDGFVDGDVDIGLDESIAEDFTVDDVFYLGEFFFCYAGEVREIKTEAGGVDEGAGLLDVSAEDLAERGV